MDTILARFNLPALALQCILPIVLLQPGPGQEISADHLQAITPGSVRSQHQGSRLEGFFNDWQLTLVKLEVDDLPRLCLPPRKVPLDLLPELFLREFLCLVHPGCTNEIRSIFPRHLDELPRLCPPHLTKLRLR